MDAVPTFTEKDVSRRVGAASYDRGQRYAAQGAIRDARRQGRTLRAACDGNAPDPYRLHVTFGVRDITDAECDCPVGDGGRCKHVAALLLTWLRAPEAFAETRPLGELLRERTKGDLVALVEQMVAWHPDLEDLVAMPVPGAGTLDARTVERQVRHAFASASGEWGSARRVARDLAALAAPGAAYATAGDWPSVLALSTALLDGIREHQEWLQDDDGDLFTPVEACVGLLARLLATDGANDRRAAAEALLGVCLWDIDLGGVDAGASAEEALRAHATDAERTALCRPVEARLDRPRTAHDGWNREALGHLLLALLPHADDDAYLAICRRSGRMEDLVERLLHLGRPDEALDAVRDVSDYVLFQIAPTFVDAGQGDAIERLAAERVGPGADRRLVGWLKERARASGDGALAARLAEHLFCAAPTAAGYAEALALGTSLGHEAATRGALRQAIQTDPALLTDVLLLDGDVDAALAQMRLPAKKWPWTARRLDLRIKVAEAAARARPDEALQLMLDAATALVERRDRASYAEAARLFARVRALYRHAGLGEGWPLFLAELRDAYKSLSAFQDELARAGL